MSFKSQREIWEALLGNKKLTFSEWSRSDFVYFNESGSLVDESGDLHPDLDYGIPGLWSIYEEPKKKKKITLYRYTYKEHSGHIFCSAWRSGEPQNIGSVVLTEAREIEVDE